jgi:23S rRNA pseudouridine2605 synthase
MPAERLQKLLARAGYGSRRHAETLITEGRVQVDGQVATLGTRADPKLSTIAVDGTALSFASPAFEVWALHKPIGYVVSASDDRGRPAIYDLLPEAPPNLRYVGRLDVDTSGLLLLTTDGELVHRLTHPRYEVWKTYEAAVRGTPSEDALRQLRAGVPLEDGPTAPARVELLRRGPQSLVRLEIREGRKREVRRMLAAVGHPVRALQRTAVGTVALGPLPAGGHRRLTASEEASLRALVGLPTA